jgi:hypothetical protein
VAEKYSKTKITKKNDIRFDVDNASHIVDLYLTDINLLFGKNSTFIAINYGK